MESHDFKAWPAGTDLEDKPREDVINASPSMHYDGALYLWVKGAGAATAALHLPRKELEEFVRVAQDFLEETKPPLPTLPHAVIQATVITPRGYHQTVVLSDADSGTNNRWTSAPVDVGGSYWFSDENIVSFEVLFPGVGEEES